MFSLKIISQEEGVNITNGKVGINTTDPEWNLHLQGLGTVISQAESSDGGTVQLRLKSNSNNRRLLALNNAGDQKSQIEFGDDYMLFAGATVTNNKALYLDLLNSRIGIGTNTPAFKFDVFDDGPTGRMRINHTTGTNTGLLLSTQGINRFSVAAYEANGGGNIDFGIYNSQTVAPSFIIDGTSDNVGIGTTSPTVKFEVSDNNVLGRIKLNHSAGNNAGLTLATQGANKFTLAAYPANGSGNIDFGIYNDQTAGPSFIVDGSTNNIGIGTTVPTEKLDVGGNIVLNNHNYFSSKRTDNFNHHVIGLNTTNNVVINRSAFTHVDGKPSAILVATGLNQFFDIRNAANQSIFRINESDGSVGIGTISPTQKIHVSDVGANTPSILVEVPGSTFLKASSGATAAALFYKSDRSLIIAPAASTGTVSAVQANSMAVVGASGNVGIGTWSPTQKLDVVGNIKASGTITPSDHRLKKNIQPYHKGLKEVELMQPVTFQYNGKGGTVKDSEHIGLIAQDVQQILPELVQHFTHTDENNEEEKYLEITDSEIQYLLINAIKELNKKIEDQQKIIVSQQTTIDQNQNQVEELKVMLERRKIKEDNPSMEISKK